MKNDSYCLLTNMSLETEGPFNASCLPVSTYKIGVIVVTGYGLVTVAAFSEACNLILARIYLQDMDAFLQMFPACIVTILAFILLA